MADQIRLAEGFDPASTQEWRELVAAVVNKGRPEDAHLTGEQAEEKLRSHLVGDLTIDPLYRRPEHPVPLGLPGSMPFTRGTGPRDPGTPWDVRQLHEDPDAAATNAAVLADLENGGHSVWVRTGPDAIDPADLPRVLEGVLLDLAPVVVSSTDDQDAAAHALRAVLENAAITPDQARGNLGLDPVGRAAARGGTTDLGTLAEHVRWSVGGFTGVRAITVDARCWHDAGAAETDVVALAVSTGVAYVRHLVEQGVDAADAFAQIEFRVPATADQFLTIAVLRALRRVWARVGELAGVPEDARGARIHAVTAWRMLTTTDPWVNVLRGTLACFGAAAGGAEAITVLPYDHAIGLPEAFSRRLARNTQSLLAQESHVGRVADPAGGSWYVESLTDELAQHAWTRVEEIDAAGGVRDAVVLADVRARIEATSAERLTALSTRRQPLTGTSTFPLAHEETPARRPRPQAPAVGEDALRPWRDGEVFEALRARAARAERTPTVMLAALGTRRDFGARETFASNLLRVAGIEPVLAEGLAGAELGEAFRAAGTTIAMLCSSPKGYEAGAAAAVETLRDAGAATVLLAGRAAEAGDAAIDGSVRDGDDVVALLSGLLDELGVPAHEAEGAPSPADAATQTGPTTEGAQA